MVDTAGTLSILSKRLESAGARNVYVCASHGLFTEQSMELIESGSVRKVVVTNSLPLHEKTSSKVVQVSVAPILAHVILAEHFRTVEKSSDEEFEMDEIGDD
jgi:ribose-phosphate pyrophosphokinase